MGREQPGGGQCNVTSLLIHALFDSDLLKTPLPAGDHFSAYSKLTRRLGALSSFFAG